MCFLIFHFKFHTIEPLCYRLIDQMCEKEKNPLVSAQEWKLRVEEKFWQEDAKKEDGILFP